MNIGSTGGGAAATPTVPPTAAPTAAPTPPANDSFRVAVPVAALPAHFTADTAGATTESGEPNTFTCGSASVTVGKTAWYTFTPSTNARVRIDTARSDFDTVVRVYTGSSLGSLTPGPCNDDISGTPQSRVPVNATGGQTYYVQVGGKNGAGGILVVNARFVAPQLAGFTTSGAAGTTVTITGSQLYGTSAVQFNTTPATISSVTNTQVVATVPAGATTGPIRATTPGGTATTAALSTPNFTVTP